MPNRTRFCVLLALLSSIAFISSSRGSQPLSPNSVLQSDPPPKNGVVYVCACLKNKSCFCMTEAKMEGPCACGTQGGPPLKAVPSDSSWARANRDALSK